MERELLRADECMAHAVVPRLPKALEMLLSNCREEQGKKGY
jgi:hypothetical protein